MICPRHGSAFDLHRGGRCRCRRIEPVATFPVTVEDGIVKVEVVET